MSEPGTALIECYRFNAQRGDYGPGDAEAHAQARLARVLARRPHELEYALPSGQVLNVRYTPIADDGLVLAYADVTARKRAEEQVAQEEAELQVALDNMPGALIFTDEDLNLVFCNDRFREMYPIPRELLQRGRPYPDVFRFLAEHGYYGEGDVGTLVARRVESLRNPLGKTFEDHAPDGKIYRVIRRRIAPHGTVTAITDVTELKRAEESLARKEAEFHVALDNMPGALVFTHEEQNLVFCNDRFAEMYPIPRELLQRGRRYRDVFRFLAEHGYYGGATSARWSPGGSKTCTTLPARRSRITHRTEGSIE